MDVHPTTDRFLMLRGEALKALDVSNSKSIGSIHSGAWSQINPDANPAKPPCYDRRILTDRNPHDSVDLRDAIGFIGGRR